MTKKSLSKNRMALWLVAVGFVLNFFTFGPPVLVDVIFLLAAIIHSYALWGRDRTAIYFVTAMVLGYIAEFIGINTGLVFGVYHYNPNDPQLIFGVPLYVPISYGYLVYAANLLCIAISRKFLAKANLWMLAVMTGFICTLKDLATDPIKSLVHQEWLWPQGGHYFGEPIQNFLGWFVVFTVITLVAVTLAWHRGGYSNKVKLERNTFVMPLTLLSVITVFGFTLSMSVPVQFMALGQVCTMMAFLGLLPYVLLGWFCLFRKGSNDLG